MSTKRKVRLAPVAVEPEKVSADRSEFESERLVAFADRAALERLVAAQSAQSFANRVYPLEPGEVQDRIERIFADWHMMKVSK